MSLQEVEYDYKDFENRDSDKGVYARFYTRPVQDETASAKEGRPIFVDKEYVEIQAAGNATNIVNRPVTEMDRRRFRRAYHLFKSGQTDQTVGTRLTEVPWITRSQCEELAFYKVLTVEQLAGVNDQFCITVPGMYELKRRAGTYLEQAAINAPTTALQKENEELKSMLADLKEAVRLQAEQIQELRTSKK